MLEKQRLEKNMRVFAEARDFGRVVALTAVIYSGDGERYAAHPAEFELVGETAVVNPTLTVSPETAQALMDSLWQCGFRPTEGSGSAGSLAATERHLKDMTTIAMGLLGSVGVKLPGSP